MPAYLVGRLRTQDWSWLREYGPGVEVLIEKHGGRYLVRGGDAERVEGEGMSVDRHVIVEFPSMEQARAFYADPEYAPLLELRKAHAETELVFVEGLGD